MFLYDAGRFDEACVHFTRAADLADGVSVYAYNKGSALMMCGRPREAAAAFLRSLNGDAASRGALLGMGRIFNNWESPAT